MEARGQGPLPLPIEPLPAQECDGAWQWRVRVAGNFPGSPVELDYRFVLEGDRIGPLEIG